MTIGSRFAVPYNQQRATTSKAPPRPFDTRSNPPPKILACSVDKNHRLLFSLQELDRRLCEDRKTPLEHLYPGNLAKSTFRIVVTQSSFILSTYANDQLQQDLARDKLVIEGKMSQEEADEAAEEWESVEWKKRWETFPSRLMDAFLKFHAIVVVMRFYEYLASHAVDKFTLDALTIDTFKTAKRIDANESNRVEVGKQMFAVCGSANLIAFLADYSVHQLILGFGYYKYIQRRRNRRKKNSNDNTKDEEEPLILKQSGSLMLSRTLGLVFTACGGAAGSMIFPGWGTLLGSNMGDSLGGMVSEAPSIFAKTKDD